MDEQQSAGETPEPRGSVWLGIVLGIGVLVGGYYFVGQIMPDSTSWPEYLFYLSLPLLLLAGLFGGFRRGRQPATSIGLGLAPLILLSLIVLLVILWAVMFSLADPASHR